jgi:hypothetical protein
MYLSYAVVERNVSAKATTKPMMLTNTLDSAPNLQGTHEMTANDQT